MSDDGWTWQFRAPAKRTYDDLDAHARDRITDKLDVIVNDQWRDPKVNFIFEIVDSFHVELFDRIDNVAARCVEIR